MSNGQEAALLQTELDDAITAVRDSPDSREHPCLSKAAVLNLKLGKMTLDYHAENRKGHDELNSKLDCLIEKRNRAERIIKLIGTLLGSGGLLAAWRVVKHGANT